MSKAFQEVDVKTSEIGNSMADFRILGELGRGSYGTVYKVTSIKNTLTYVLKKISMKHMKPKQQQSALKEVQILKFLDHPHIIKYYTSFMEEESIHIVMEYAEKGDLYKLLKEQRQRRKYFSEKDLWDFSYQICMAVEYLHQKNIIHRDIKCLNIFLTEEKSIKIGDLGVSKIVSTSVAMQDTRVGTPLYLSPELVKQQPYDFKVDVWAIGCALYHLACLEPPFQGDNLITLGNNIVNKKHKPLPQIYSSKLMNFIDKLLMKKPGDRPTSRESVILIPSFVKSAYKENHLSGLKQIVEEPQQALGVQTSIVVQDKSRSMSPQKDQQLRLLQKKQMEEQIAKKRMLIPTLINPAKQDTSVINNSKSQDKQQDRIITAKRNENVVLSYDRKSTKVDDKLIEKIEILPLKQQNAVNQSDILTPKGLTQRKDPTPTGTSKTGKSQFQPSEQFPYQNSKPLLYQQPPNKSESQKDLKQVQQHKPYMNNYSSNANDDTTATTGTKQVTKLNIVQFRMEGAVQKADQNVSALIKKGEVDLLKMQQQQVQQQNFMQEMPYIARPQTASASQIYSRQLIQKSTVVQSVSNDKPGVSLLRNLASKNSQENLILQMQQQNPAQYRPFSAAIPIVKSITQGKKKNVMFDVTDRNDALQNSDDVIVDIPNDDEGLDNDYVQFNSSPKIVQTQLNSPPIVASQESTQLPIKNGNLRPFTAIAPIRNTSVPQTNAPYQNVNLRRSYDQQHSQQSHGQFSTNPQPRNLSNVLNPVHQARKVVAQSIELGQDKAWQNMNPNKNELNRQSQEDFETKFGKFFQRPNLKKPSTLVSITSQSSIKNLQQQPMNVISTVHSVVSQPENVAKPHSSQKNQAQARPRTAVSRRVTIRDLQK